MATFCRAGAAVREGTERLQHGGGKAKRTMMGPWPSAGAGDAAGDLRRGGGGLAPSSSPASSPPASSSSSSSLPVPPPAAERIRRLIRLRTAHGRERIPLPSARRRNNTKPQPLSEPHPHSHFLMENINTTKCVLCVPEGRVVVLGPAGEIVKRVRSLEAPQGLRQARDERSLLRLGGGRGGGGLGGGLRAVGGGARSREDATREEGEW